jgi:hypothetical protein
MNVADEAHKFFEQRLTAAGLNRALKAQALADTTIMVLRRGIDRQRAADLVEQFAALCDFTGVDVTAEIAKGLDAAEIKQSPPAANGSALRRACFAVPDTVSPGPWVRAWVQGATSSPWTVRNSLKARTMLRSRSPDIAFGEVNQALRFDRHWSLARAPKTGGGVARRRRCPVIRTPLPRDSYVLARHHGGVGKIFTVPRYRCVRVANGLAF